jgi:sulfoxide reductase heme-binding subunit YedZ
MNPSLFGTGNRFASNPLWYATRSTGLVAFVLLTIAVALGVLTTQRVATPRWPRFASQSLHRYVSLLAMLFLATHIVTTLLDSYVTINWWAAIVPFVSSYRTFEVAVGTIAVDLLLVVTATSLWRGVTGHRWWRLVHWSSYAVWPLALAHYLGTGTDARKPWSLGLALLSIAVVFVAILVRLAIERREGPTRVLGGTS